MAYLFDTDAILEAMRPEPLPLYLNWLRSIPREDQFTSAVSIGELFGGTHRSPRAIRHLDYFGKRLLPAITVLPFDVAIAREYGRIHAALSASGTPVPETDIQIAATAIYHGLVLVTGNPTNFRRIRELRIEPILERARG